jgi:hypothetical protein
MLGAPNFIIRFFGEGSIIRFLRAQVWSGVNTRQ